MWEQNAYAQWMGEVVFVDNISLKGISRPASSLTLGQASAENFVFNEKNLENVK